MAIFLCNSSGVFHIFWLLIIPSKSLGKKSKWYLTKHAPTLSSFLKDMPFRILCLVFVWLKLYINIVL